jgi:hypothetical protein
MFRNRYLLHWPEALVGIDWLGLDTFSPPARFVVGRLLSTAWIADVLLEREDGQVVVVIGWDASTIDPLGCTLVIRTEGEDSAALLMHQVRISDLPGSLDTATSDEPRHRRWDERTLRVPLPRGSRHSAWGASLFSSDGRLLDERPTVRRYESASIGFRVVGSPQPGSTTVVGDRAGPPSEAEIDDATKVAETLVAEAREASAGRRFSTAGELERYLRWRFSCRAGELLVLDPYLLDGQEAVMLATVAFLQTLRRPIRALCKSLPASATPGLGRDARSRRAAAPAWTRDAARPGVARRRDRVTRRVLNQHVLSERPRRGHNRDGAPVRRCGVVAAAFRRLVASVSLAAHNGW